MLGNENNLEEGKRGGGKGERYVQNAYSALFRYLQSTHPKQLSCDFRELLQLPIHRLLLSVSTK